MIKVVAHTSTHDELARIVDKAVFADVCGAVTELVAVVEGRRQERVSKVAVHELRAREALSCQEPVVANIGGKITHYRCKDVHTPGARPSIQRQVNDFGVFQSVYTGACNFHTGSTKTSTLFRGGRVRSDVLEAIDHIFLKEAVAEVLVNNIVFTARLGHPVSPKNFGIRRALQALGAGSVELSGPMEDTMFVHCITVRFKNLEWLHTHGVHDMPDLCVRMNICRTGVLNLFFGITGGVALASAPEERLLQVCHVLTDTVKQVV